MGRFGEQDYPAPGRRRAAPAAQEQDEGKVQTAPKETIVAGGNGKGGQVSTGCCPNRNSKSGEKLLILGCGTGLDLEYIPKGVDITAVDITPAMVSKN